MHDFNKFLTSCKDKHVKNFHFNIYQIPTSETDKWKSNFSKTLSDSFFVFEQIDLLLHHHRTHLTQSLRSLTYQFLANGTVLMQMDPIGCSVETQQPLDSMPMGWRWLASRKVPRVTIHVQRRMILVKLKSIQQ